MKHYIAKQIDGITHRKRKFRDFEKAKAFFDGAKFFGEKFDRIKFIEHKTGTGKIVIAVYGICDPDFAFVLQIGIILIEDDVKTEGINGNESCNRD